MVADVSAEESVNRISLRHSLLHQLTNDSNDLFAPIGDLFALKDADKPFMLHPKTLLV